MKNHVYRLTLLIFLFGFSIVLTAQDDGEATPEVTPEATTASTPDAEITEETVEATCPALVERALRLTEDGCEGTGPNEVCYGHFLLDAALRGNVEPQRFANPGDVIDVLEIQNLSLSALDTTAGIWGVVLLQLEAALELATEQGAVTYVVFGDAELESASELVPVITTTNANIREEPSQNSAIIQSLPEGEQVVASGRTVDNAWLRIRLQNADTPPVGWLFAELVEIEGDDIFSFDDLPIAAVEDETDLENVGLVDYGPMQAFYFQSAEDDAPCEQAPDSGLLIQTPEGQASVSVWIDEVVIELSATAFIQAGAGDDITINVLDGAAQVTANGETRTATAGTSISVPLDENLSAIGVPGEPQPIDPDDIQSLPVELLPEQITIAAPLSGDGLPANGTWAFNWGVDSLTCPDDTVVTFESAGTAGSITVAEDGSTLSWGGGTYTRSAQGVYNRDFVDGNGNLHQDTLTVQALDRIAGVKIVDYAAVVCSLEVPFSLQLLGN